MRIYAASLYENIIIRMEVTFTTEFLENSSIRELYGG